MGIIVYEIELKVYLLKDILAEDTISKIAYFIDSSLVNNKKLEEFHKSRNPKNYCFNSLYPIEKNGIYKEGRIYTILIRTVNKELKDFFMENLKNVTTDEMKGLITKARNIKRKVIDKVISVTPLIMKMDKGYWREKENIEKFLEQLKIHLIKKYNLEYSTKINETFPLFTKVVFKNRVPIGVKYKNIKLLGDKVELEIAKNTLAQEIAYFSLGVGCGCMGARGYSFVNPRWLEEV